MTPQPRRPTAADDNNLEWRLRVVERDLEAQEQRIGGEMKVLIEHETQINGPRGIFSAIAELVRAIEQQRVDHTTALNEIRDEIRKDRETRTTRLWQLAGGVLVAFVGAFATIYAAGLVQP